MNALTAPLREEHRALRPYVEEIRVVADSVGSADQATLLAGLDRVLGFLTGHLRPHAEAEETALYPTVADILGAPEATGTMVRDHVEVRALSVELQDVRDRLAARGPSDQTSLDLRRLLYGLYAVVGLHFAKEEELYLPLLESALGPDEAARVFAAMEAASAASRIPDPRASA